MTEIEVFRAEVDLEKAIIDMNRYEQELKELKAAAVQGGASVEQMSSRIKRASRNLKTAQKEVERLNASMAGTRRRSNAAGVAIQQIGYSMQDLQYGIHSVANNMQYMLSLFGSMAVEAKKTGESIKKQLMTAIIGPQGIIAGIMILMSFLPQIIDFFKKFRSTASVVGEAMDELDNKTKKVGGRMQGFKMIMDKGNASLKEREVIAKELSKTNKDLIDKNGNLITSEEELNEVIERQIELLEARNEVKAIEALIEEQLSIIREARKSLDESSPWSITSILFGEANINALDKKTIKDAQAILDKILPRYRELLEKLGLSDGGKTIGEKMIEQFTSKKERSEAAKAQVGMTKMEKLTYGYNQQVKKIEELRKNKTISDKDADTLLKLALNTYSNDKDTLLLEEKEKATKRLDGMLDKYADILDKRNDEVETKGMNNVEKVRYFHNKKIAEIRALKGELDSEGNRLYSDEDISLLEGLANNVFGFDLDDAEGKDFEDKVNKKLEKFKQITSVFKDILGAYKQFSDAQLEVTRQRLQAERELVIANENLTQEEKDKRLKAIEKAERKAQIDKIKQEQKFQMIMLGIKATEITAELLADGAKQIGKGTMSLGSFVSALGPWGIAAYAASIGGIIASIVAARKKAKAQIESILGAPSQVGSSGGSTSGPAAPNFNIIGSSQQSSLAQTINQRMDPLKAYVVYDDIKSAEQMEKMAEDAASVG